MRTLGNSTLEEQEAEEWYLHTFEDLIDVFEGLREVEDLIKVFEGLRELLSGIGNIFLIRNLKPLLRYSSPIKGPRQLHVVI